MIWSTKTPELRRAYENLRAARPSMLQKTDLFADDFANRDIPFEPIEYLEVPPKAHEIGKLVVPYAVIDARGFLNTGLPRFFAVTARPNTGSFDTRAIARRSQQAHVIAEDLSLRRGLFTPHARSSSEVLVADMLPEAYRSDYIGDRVAHLHALSDEVADHGQLAERQNTILMNELELAVKSLESLAA